jgi:hypothetical protein
MRIALALLAAGLVAWPAAQAQPIYKCTGPGGRITYQETPCPAAGGQQRLDGARTPGDPVARELLERDARGGDPLARGYVDELRESDRRERQKQIERLEREEKARRANEVPVKPEDVPWVTPWGFPGKPGQARPQPRPAK